MEVQTVYLIMGYFLGFEKYGIDVFYNRKYQRWLVDNSTDAESLNSENNNFEPEFNEAGFIINVKFTAFHNSIPLTENDFIDIQIKRLNTFLELEDLKSMDLIQIQHFKRHLEDRRKKYQQSISQASEQTEIAHSSISCFKQESIENITTTLNTFFNTSQHAELKRIIETGSNTNNKLLFRDNGNRLTDYFKRLFENDTITGCNKKDLINWIVENFKFFHRSNQKDFIYKTVEKTISGNEQPCKNPIK